MISNQDSIPSHQNIRIKIFSLSAAFQKAHLQYNISLEATRRYIPHQNEGSKPNKTVDFFMYFYPHELLSQKLKGVLIIRPGLEKWLMALCFHEIGTRS